MRKGRTHIEDPKERPIEGTWSVAQSATRNQLLDGSFNASSFIFRYFWPSGGPWKAHLGPWASLVNPRGSLGCVLGDPLAVPWAYLEALAVALGVLGGPMKVSWGSFVVFGGSLGDAWGFLAGP